MKGLFLTLAALGLVFTVGCGSSVDGGTGGGGASTTSDTSSGGAGGAVASCGACVGPIAESGGSCTSALDACTDDQDCGAWLQCSRACWQSDAATSCYDACNQAHPNASALYSPVQSCICDSCAHPCSAGCAGG